MSHAILRARTEAADDIAALQARHPGRFLARHQDKLFFGSACACADGRGSGVSQQNNPGARRLAGKCVARETLTLLRRSTTPDVFRKLAWDNGRRFFRLDTV